MGVRMKNTTENNLKEFDNKCNVVIFANHLAEENITEQFTLKLRKGNKLRWI